MINWILIAILIALVLSSYITYKNAKFKNKKEKNRVRSILIIIWVILIIFTSIGLLVINKDSGIRKINNEDKQTGNWYYIPKSIEEIETIFIDYNNHDIRIDFNKNEVSFAKFDNEGDYIVDSDGNVKRNYNYNITNELKDYVMNTVTKKLTKQSTSYDKWNISIHSDPTGSASAGGENEAPKWFNKLLDLIEFDKYKIE